MVFSAHMDTVQPCAGIEPVVVDGVVRSAGDTILSADDKAGVAAIFEGVRSAVESGSPRPDVTVLLTTCEEQHLLGSSALADGLLPAGAPCYVLDADGAPGTIITGAPCHWSLNATFSGRAAHAGVCPEEGASAIAMVAAAVSSMPLGRLDEATTANVGFIEGGGATNVVPDTCALAGECRSLYAERAEAQKEAMTEALEAAAARFGGAVSIEWTKSYDAVLFDEEDELVQAIVRASRAAGLEPRFHRSGGGSDANVLAARGVRPVTLGVGMAAFMRASEGDAAEAERRRKMKAAEEGSRIWEHFFADRRRSRGDEVRIVREAAALDAALYCTALCSPPPSASRPTTWSPPTNGLPGAHRWRAWTFRTCSRCSKPRKSTGMAAIRCRRVRSIFEKRWTFRHGFVTSVGFTCDNGCQEV